MKNFDLRRFAIAATLAFLPSPANSQSLNWTENAKATTYRPDTCRVSIFSSDTDKWTRGPCDEIALTESSESLNIHFETDGVRKSQLILTFVIPAKNRGRQVMPVVAIGLNADGERTAIETVGGFDDATNRCEVAWPNITCNAIVREGSKAWGFVATASLE